jgi:hypothetical protein
MNQLLPKGINVNATDGLGIVINDIALSLVPDDIVPHVLAEAKKPNEQKNYD